MNSPRLDAFRLRLKNATEAHGSKIQLARWLASELPGQAASYQVTVLDFLSGKSTPGGEIILAIQAWLDGQNHTTKTRTEKPL